MSLVIAHKQNTDLATLQNWLLNLGKTVYMLFNDNNSWYICTQQPILANQELVQSIPIDVHLSSICNLGPFFTMAT